MSRDMLHICPHRVLMSVFEKQNKQLAALLNKTQE